MRNLETDNSNNLNNSWIKKSFFWMYISISWWIKVLVTNLLNWEKSEIEWPKRIFSPTNNVREFQRIDLQALQKIVLYKPWEKQGTEIVWPDVVFNHPDGKFVEYNRKTLESWEKWWIFDEKWNHREVEWPNEFYIHPEWKLLKFQKIQISQREAIVIIWQDWKEKIIEWKDSPEILINPFLERVKRFYWTWSWEEGWDTEKVPWALTFEKLRLDDTQTYFSFPVRTKDNVEIEIKLMIFYSISNLEKLVTENHDPLCEFYNKIQSEVTKEISRKNFDNFKEDTWKKISKMEFFKNDPFWNIWIKIDAVNLRQWSPQEIAVQRVLEESAMVQSQKDLDKSNHKRNMKNIKYEQTQLKERQKLAQWEKEQAKQRWEASWEELWTIIEKLGEKLPEGNKDEAISLMKLYLASKAQTLNIWSDLLK